MKRLVLALSVIAALGSSIAYAHSEGTHARGWCHDTKTGNTDNGQ